MPDYERIVHAIKHELIREGLVRESFPQEQRPLSVAFLGSRAARFLELCKVLDKYEGIYANWESSRYHPEFPDPYLQFELNSVRFRAGCRKRVFEVIAEFPESKDFSALKEIAVDRDRVTYYCDGAMKGTQGMTVMVHAWDTGKLEEYLEIIMDLADVEMREENWPSSPKVILDRIVQTLWPPDDPEQPWDADTLETIGRILADHGYAP